MVMHTRLNKGRYALHGPWRQIAYKRYSLDGDGGNATIRVEVADLEEVGPGHVWHNGAYKVTLTNVPDMRSKTFYGETAWSDAQRYIDDAANKVGRWASGITI